MFAFPPPASVTVPVIGSQNLFPVRRIFCVGRNYKAHASEMGAAPGELPCFFTKPADAIVLPGADGNCKAPYPKATRDLHHEVELVAALGPASNGEDSVGIFGYAVGLDLTRRDLQSLAKQKQWPWDMAKGFDASAPLSPIMPIATTGEMIEGKISLAVNGQPRQSGNISEMIWPVAAIIRELQALVDLCPGDLIFTGTPAGVGPLQPGDSFTAEIERVGTLQGRIV